MAQRFVTAQRLRTRALRLAGSLFAPRYRTAAWRVVSLSQTWVWSGAKDLVEARGSDSGALERLLSVICGGVRSARFESKS